MNYWTEKSLEYANQRSYLDDLFVVYPTIPNGIREINEDVWKEVELAFQKQNNITLIKNLCRLEKFPIKDSYIAFLKMDSSSIERNPQTINRIAGNLYDMGIDKLWEKCSEPKETNTQIGPMFKHWIEKKSLGILPISTEEFLATKNNAILKGGDTELNRFAKEHFGYGKDKGLDFVARFNGKYILGETKFITAIGGNQNNSFTDVLTTLKASVKGAICIGIIDGIPWLKDKSKYYTEITSQQSEYNIMSSLVLREFLYQV
jgi:Tsp45I type II restriction enzyme